MTIKKKSSIFWWSQRTANKHRLDWKAVRNWFALRVVFDPFGKKVTVTFSSKENNKQQQGQSVHQHSNPIYPSLLNHESPATTILSPRSHAPPPPSISSQSHDNGVTTAATTTTTTTIHQPNNHNNTVIIIPQAETSLPLWCTCLTIRINVMGTIIISTVQQQQQYQWSNVNIDSTTTITSNISLNEQQQ